jgi:hypothetical protein
MGKKKKKSENISPKETQPADEHLKKCPTSPAGKEPKMGNILETGTTQCC